jgi:DNA-binding NarL/FixJ family response regulator
MKKAIILAGPNTIFRSGAARILSLEMDMSVVLQSGNYSRCHTAIERHRSAVVLFSYVLLSEHVELIQSIKRAESGVILIADATDLVPPDLIPQLDARLPRNLLGADLVKCVRRVSRGHRSVHSRIDGTSVVPDPDGDRVRDCLTPKEMLVVSLISRAAKNKEIAERLGIKEQVVKNHLTVIFEKTGLGDRLELALFTMQHPSMFEAANNAGSLLRVKSIQPAARSWLRTCPYGHLLPPTCDAEAAAKCREGAAAVAVV